MKTIDEDIRTGNFKQIYLLYGTEGYLKKQYRDKLKTALQGNDGMSGMGGFGGMGGDMNFSAFEGKDTNPKAIIDLAETLPFFADRRVILIENSGFFKNSCED
ncbi:MAG: DNA polymerase III subunit delta, partial [Roseburia sp.]|nr:DNA polymerase III subunit delta [Roseburia sp.]